MRDERVIPPIVWKIDVLDQPVAACCEFDSSCNITEGVLGMCGLLGDGGLQFPDVARELGRAQSLQEVRKEIGGRRKCYTCIR